MVVFFIFVLILKHCFFFCVIFKTQKNKNSRQSFTHSTEYLKLTLQVRIFNKYEECLLTGVCQTLTESHMIRLMFELDSPK